MAGLLNKVLRRRSPTPLPASPLPASPLPASPLPASPVPDTAGQAVAMAAAEPTQDQRDQLARQSLTSQMQAILDRPQPRTIACGCCGTTLDLERAESLNSRCIFTNLELRRFRCAACQAVIGPVQLIACEPAELGQLYATLYSFYREGATQRAQEKSFYLMNPSSVGSYVNYACGDWAVGVARLRSIGWQVWGYEPFQSIGAEGIIQDEATLRQRQYTGLLSNNYIEHVQNPVAFFHECHSLLEPGGKMAHASPCFDYVYDFTAFHLYFYCADSVRRLAERTGFRVLAEHRVDQHVPDASFICYVFQRD